MTPLGRLATSDTALSRRSRYGDRGAAHRLAARHLDRVAELASVMGDEHPEGLVRRAFALALRGKRPFEDALVTAFARLAATTSDPEGARGRLLVLLVEVEGRPVAEAAALIGLGADEAGAMLPAARTSAGLAALPRRCRGWGLVYRRGLTSAEHQAGADHLLLCRRCRERLASLDRTRAQLLGGSAGLVAGLAATHLLAPGGSGTAAGVGSLAASKAVAGLVAAAAGVVLASAGTTAVIQQPRHTRPVAPRPSGAPVAPSTGGQPSCTGCAPTPGPSSLLGVTVPVAVPPIPLPAVSVPPLPTLPGSLPSLPVPLPSLPLPLPSLPLPLPTLPVPSATLPALP